MSPKLIFIRSPAGWCTHVTSRFVPAVLVVHPTQKLVDGIDPVTRRSVLSEFECVSTRVDPKTVVPPEVLPLQLSRSYRKMNWALEATLLLEMQWFAVM
jgi:hypothetical protein